MSLIQMLDGATDPKENALWIPKQRQLILMRQEEE